MKNKTIGIFIIAILIAMISVTSASSVNLVHKDSNWNEIDSASTLSYTMNCPATMMEYTYTLNQNLNVGTPTEYCLLFYTRNDEGISWLNSDNQVWGNQGSKIIQCVMTDSDGYFAPMTGTFDFNSYGTGLDYINDGDDYSGSVEGAKVWLVPKSDITTTGTGEDIVDAVTGWHPSNFLWETELIQCINVQEVIVTVNCPMSFEVSPLTYDYGTIYPGDCSGDNPNGQITLSNTGCPNLLISTVTTGIFENIDYAEGSTWVDANNFDIIINKGDSKSINTKICIPNDAALNSYTGTVTFEYLTLL